MTGDDHGGAGTLGRFDAELQASAAGCSVDDWQCVRSTSYVYPNTSISDAQARQYTGLGFEVALHLNTSCVDFKDSADLDAMLVDQLAGFRSALPGIPAPSTNRTHCITWSDYDTEPKVELAHGIRLDTTYYYWPGQWIEDRPGFMTGSGVPMRFADRTGQTIDVYQAATQMTDESGQSFPWNPDTLLDNALGSKGYYGVFTANMHTDAVDSWQGDTIVASARSRGVPVISAKQLLTWLDGRNGSTFRDIAWTGAVLTFDVSAASGARNLRALLPADFGGRTISALTRAGTSVPFTVETIKGVRYAVFAAVTDSYQAEYR
jgi:hypothetical protein